METPDRVRRVAFVLWGDTLQTTVQEGAANAHRRAVLTRDARTDAVLHLPPGVDSPALDLPLAIAAHAAAHLRFGGEAQSRAGLKPVQQALLGVLEDARVEWLALQDLPGLQAVWSPFHAEATTLSSTGFDDLLARLSARLLAPAQADPHAWVERVRRRFFCADGRTLAVRTPAEVRELASVLGHDIGQMRLPFNVRTYQVHARYRDDNSHLWLPDHTLPPSDVPLQADTTLAACEPAAAAKSSAGSNAPDAVYPEWDYRISRYRPDWCRVYCVDPPAGQPAWLPGALNREKNTLARRIAGTVGSWRHSSSRSVEGDVLHPSALVDAALDLRSQRTPDPRLHRQPWRATPPLAVMLLLDASASTARGGEQGRLGWGGQDEDVLLRIQRSAATASLALQKLGHRSALWAFSSKGRHRVELTCLKHWNAPLPALPRLRGGGSTRLGVALRHALALSEQDARQHPGFCRVIVVLTDGELHDIDVHEPGYLPADLCRAAAQAENSGVVVRALVVERDGVRALAESLGPDRVRFCAPGAGLHRALSSVLSGAF